MRLTAKFAAAFVLMFACLFGSAWLILDRLVRAEFARVESHQHEQDTSRVIAGLDARKRDLTARVVDYASWDDARRFLLGGAPNFPAQNFTDDWFASYDVDLVLFVDSKGEIVWGRNRGGEGGAFEASKFLYNVVKTDAAGATLDKPASGVVWTQHGPLLYAARPASTSLGEGPAVGLVAIGQFLSSARLKQETQLNLDFVSMIEPNTSMRLQTALKEIAEKNVVSWQDGDRPETLIGLRAANGRSVGAIRAYHTSAVAALGERSILVASLLLGGASAAALLCLWLLVQTTVTGPLHKLERHFKRQGDGITPYEGHISRDEIGRVAAAYNALAIRARTAIEREETAVLASEANERANRVKSDYITSMSHELRTPLTSIMGYCELLKEDFRAAGLGDSERDLGKIDAAAHQLLGLINEILDMSKIEGGQMEIAAAPFDVALLVRDVADNMRPVAQRSGNTLVVECDDGLGVANTDAKRLRQCMLTLLTNACKFTKRGGVTLRVSRFTKDDQPWLLVEVEDTGIGMSPSQAERLSDMFARADSEEAEAFSGASLGLPITARLLAMMGGSIAVRSMPGAGSLFAMRVPAALAGAPMEDGVLEAA